MNNRKAITQESHFNALWDTFENLTIPRSRLLSNMTRISEKKYGNYETNFERLPESNVLLHGYFQSWKYFKKYENELRKELVIKKSLQAKAREYLTHIARRYNATNITFVGVHVRRGDILKKTHLYRVASLSYIVKAMNAFRRNYSRVHLVVCSDDISWCIRNLGQQMNVSFSTGKPVTIDFAILCQGNHTLSTVGTFSWWVGRLVGGTTTYYNKHAIESTYMYKYLNVADFFLPKWISMSD